MKKETILVFTGGGLAPALNPTLYGVIKEARKFGYRILGGMYGWASLSKNGRIIDLTKLNVESIKKRGGTFLRSSRTNLYKVEGGLEQLKGKLKEQKIDHLIAIGGDDTLGAARKLYKNEKINIVGIPKTIDNDLSGTYWSPGFPSAAHYTAQYTKEVREDAAYSLSRIFIIEVLGRKSGWITASAYYGGSDVIIVPPERKVDIKNFLDKLVKRYAKNGNFAVVVISEEADFGKSVRGVWQDQKDSFGIRRKSLTGVALRDIISSQTGIDTKVLIPGNYIQAGEPIKIDRDVAVKLGQRAVNLVNQKKFGRMSCVVKKGKAIEVDDIDLAKVVGKNNLKVLDDSYFDFKNFRPKQKLLDYFEPILGKYQTPDPEYYKLIAKINQ
ncbi:MAG: 6-phosphofructokinase [Patescibacteria group bacterium]